VTVCGDDCVTVCGDDCGADGDAACAADREVTCGDEGGGDGDAVLHAVTPMNPAKPNATIAYVFLTSGPPHHASWIPVLPIRWPAERP